MKRQTLIFLSILFASALIAVFLPGILLKLQDNSQIGQLHYAQSTNYSFSTDEQRLSFANRLLAASKNNSSKVTLDFDAASHTYGDRESMIETLNEELTRFCEIAMPSLPAYLYPSLPDDAYLRLEYSLDNATMQGFMFCVAECSLAQGDMYLITDMENGRIVQLELYNTSLFPRIYDYFSLRISENLAEYLGFSLVESAFTVDTLNMLLSGGGQGGKMVFSDETQEIPFYFSCWQNGLIFYPSA